MMKPACARNALKSRILRVVGMGLLSGATLTVHGSDCPDTDPEALRWLARMSQSSHELNYHGVVTFERGNDTQVVNVSHSVLGGTRSERLSHLTGKGADVIRLAHPLDTVDPGHKILRLGAAEGECGIAHCYRLELGESERVAGRRAVQLTIQPRDMYRYGYSLSLDAETGLLLRFQTTGRGGIPLERFQFVSLDLDPRTARRATSQSPAPRATSRQIESWNATANSFAPVGIASTPSAVPTAPTEQPMVVEAGASLLTASNAPGDWRVGWLPVGFMATEPQGGGHRLTFTDGLAVFSVFLDRPDGSLQPGEGVVRQGSTTTYVRGLRLGGEAVLATLIGEVPLNTARMVVDSIAMGQ